MSAGSRVFQYMNRLPVVNLTGGLTLPQSEIKGCVSLERVTFAYKSRPNQVDTSVEFKVVIILIAH